MKLKVSKEAILEGLQKVQSIVGVRTTLPILQNILFKADKDKLWLSATDLEVSVRASVPAEVSKPGATTMPARRVFSIFRELSGAEIEIEADEKVTIRCGASVFKIVSMSEDEFPPLPKFEGGKTYTLDQLTLKEMLKNTSFAVSTDESRYILNGVLLSFKGDKLAVVATDGRRMALYEQEVEFPKGSEGDMVLPFKTVDELLKTLKDEGTVKIQATENQIAFEFDEMLVVSKLLEGTYPNFRQVIPAQFGERVTVEREGLLTALQTRVSCGEREVEFRQTGVRKEQARDHGDIGRRRRGPETLAVNYAGKQLTLPSTPVRWIRLTLAKDQVFLELTDELSPGVVKADVPFLYVLMPMRMS